MHPSGRLGAMHAPTELYEIEDPGPNDVLFGRGTGSNMHSGNIRFRALIQKYKPVYRDTPKKMKPSVSTKVVAIWRSQDPPGRFLTRSDRFHGSRRTFYDVGDAMARRKAAQCLREKSSKERVVQQLKERELEVAEGDTEAPEKSSKNPDDDSSKLMQQEAAKGEIVPSLGESVKAAAAAAKEGKDVRDTHGATEHVVEIMSSQQPKKPKSREQEEVFSSNININMDKLPLSSGNTKPSGSFNDFGLELPLKLTPTTSKSMALPSTFNKESQGADFFSCGSSNKNDAMSLLDTYAASKLEEDPVPDDRNATSHSPFLFASFGFENNQGSNEKDNGEGGLCFPSLFGEETNHTSSSLFTDDNSSSLFGGGSATAASLFDDEPEGAASFPPSLPSTVVPQIQKKEALQNIRDIMPTAASLTNNLFDW